MKRYLKLTEEPVRRTYGFLHATETSTTITLEYGGNMGATLKDIEKCFVKLYPGVSFEHVLSLGAPMFDDPSYMWLLGPLDLKEFFKK